MSRFFPCLVLLLGAASPLVAAEEAQPNAPLRPGDAILVRIDGVGGGIPEYREIVDSDGNIEMPFLGFLSADGKVIAGVETEMAAAYAQAKLSTGAVVHIAFVTHFDPPPARQTLLRSQDPRRPVSAGEPLPAEK